MKDTLDQASGRITTQQYWEAGWRDAALPGPLDPVHGSYFSRLLHRCFKEALARQGTGNRRFIEIGCGTSHWLPYFCNEFGFTVSGIDYSPTGCANSREILRRAGCAGDIREGDMFAPPPQWLSHFDVVGSFGLVEHFKHTAAAVAACATYLRPGGCMITLVPTMRGLPGLAYRLARRAVYDTHVPLGIETLAQAHRQAGLEVASCRYLLGLPGVLGEFDTDEKPLSVRGMIKRISRGYWWLEERGLGVPPNRYTSPYALCIATKPVA
ncbi:protein of unknown function [Georgfuchsia toluolica]|uniref:Methyltransferase domain-containing protein n=1 Tax=Georgfuchsia toluolica TaxID=424218 RepID=A0A916J858_9PROT|nr:class I SAM-dependent methyltransferase [Georgfuchsia toluolica]CAG4884166.1 protein of unknown function [Georgfuchsia toluolica]